MQIHWADATIFIAYLCAMLGVGFYFWNRNKSSDDYYVGGRKLSPGHIGLSVVATDVGGGFSIGLGGLGFVMGIAGNWMLLTGLIGAWLSAVFLIPVVYPVAREKGFLSFPQALSHYYTKNVALLAGVISMVGYIGFTSAQILAGAKLASATFPSISVREAVMVMGVIAVAYTVIGGIKAVIYTDTIQWILLLSGLIFIGIPVGYIKIGGWEAILSHTSEAMRSVTSVSVVQLINWAVTIIPIWFIGMTLYQRIYASRDLKSAKKAWRIAGLFEWPVMAFIGVLLGLFARVAFEQGMFSELGFAAGSEIDSELGLPLFLRHILPAGLMGLMMSAYFSAIMSTADSCLMAASGNLVTDVLGRLKTGIKMSYIRVSQLATLGIGVLSIILASRLENVLTLMLHSYAFMVAGLFVPVIAMLVIRKPSPVAALVSMFTGGSATLGLIITKADLPWGVEPILPGILLSGISFGFIQTYFNVKNNNGLHNA